MNLDQFNGRFVTDKSENYEEYLKALGVPLIFRKLAASISVTEVIKKEGNKWTFGQESVFKNSSNEFELDKEFVESMADGRKFMSTVTLTTDNMLVTKQRKIKSDGASTFTRYLENNGNTLVVLMQYENVTAKMTYKRQK